MSQIFKTDNTSPAGDVETLTGNTGGPVGPDAAFNINVLGGTGILVTGDPGTNTLTITDNDLVQGSVTTTDATPTTCITFPMGSTPGVYVVEGRIAAFNTTDTAGAGYFFVGAARTTGIAGTEVAVQYTNDLEEAAMAAADIDFVVSANNIVIQVTGIAAKTITWSAEFEYQFTS